MPKQTPRSVKSSSRITADQRTPWRQPAPGDRLGRPRAGRRRSGRRAWSRWRRSDALRCSCRGLRRSRARATRRSPRPPSASTPRGPREGNRTPTLKTTVKGAQVTLFPTHAYKYEGQRVTSETEGQTNRRERGHTPPPGETKGRGKRKDNMKVKIWTNFSCFQISSHIRGSICLCTVTVYRMDLTNVWWKVRLEKTLGSKFSQRFQSDPPQSRYVYMHSNCV